MRKPEVSDSEATNCGYRNTFLKYKVDERPLYCGFIECPEPWLRRRTTGRRVGGICPGKMESNNVDTGIIPLYQSLELKRSLYRFGVPVAGSASGLAVY